MRIASRLGGLDGRQQLVRNRRNHLPLLWQRQEYRRLKSRASAVAARRVLGHTHLTGRTCAQIYHNPEPTWSPGEFRRWRVRLVGASQEMAILPLHLGKLVSWTIRHREGVTWGITVFPLLFVIVMCIWKLTAPSFYHVLVAENSLVELATFLVYLLASAVAASLALDLWRQSRAIFSGLYFVLSAGLFIISMEEISWGQKLIKNATPEFFQKYNYQSETNFHNFEAFPLHEAFIFVGLYGILSRVISSVILKIRDKDTVNLLTPPYYLLLFFFFTFTLYVYYEYLNYTQLQPLGLTWGDFFTPEHFIIGKDQEPIELLLGLAFLLFVVVNKFRYRRGGPAARFALHRAT